MAGAVDAGPSLKRKSEVVYRALQGRVWRAAVVWTAYRCGRVVKILYTRNGKQFVEENVMVELVNQPIQVLSEAEVKKRIPHWKVLQQDLEYRLSKTCSKDHNRGDDPTVDHMPLYIFMQTKNYKAHPISKGTLRLGTFNIKHFGAKKTHTGMNTRTGCDREGCARASLCDNCKEEPERMKIHDDERARNLVEVIHQARCSVVFLQEISADTDLLCGLLEKRHGVRWSSTKIVGEHAMIYQCALLASFLECGEDELKIEYALYSKTPLSSTFKKATRWGDFQKGDVQKPRKKVGRYDYGMQGLGAARLPALFFVHNGQPHTSDSTFRSIAVCSVHLAFGQPEIRKRQLEHRSCPVRVMMKLAVSTPSSVTSTRPWEKR
jgi:hypothetical protein